MSNVSLESKAKLPQKILEIISDGSSLLAIPQSSSLSANILLAGAKQMAAIEPVIDGSSEMINNIESLVNEMEISSQDFDKGLDQVCDIQERLQLTERQNYYCSVPKSNSADSFTSSITSDRN